jgi:hypothetical protein
MSTPDRSYIIEVDHDGVTEKITVDTFDMNEYACGVKAGDKLKLKLPIPLEDDHGNVVRTIPKGSVWTVLTGSSQDPGCLWLAEPSGDAHTWDDDKGIFEIFAKA